MNTTVLFAIIASIVGAVAAKVIDNLETDYLEAKCDNERLKSSGPGHDWSKYTDRNSSVYLALLKIGLIVLPIALLLALISKTI